MSSPMLQGAPAILALICRRTFTSEGQYHWGTGYLGQVAFDCFNSKKDYALKLHEFETKKKAWLYTIGISLEQG